MNGRMSDHTIATAIASNDRSSATSGERERTIVATPWETSSR